MDAAAPAPVLDDGGLGLHRQVTSLRGLLALSILMMERREEREVLHLAATAVPGLMGCRTVGVQLRGEEWAEADGLTRAERAALAARLRAVGPAGGPVQVPGEGWAVALQLRDLGEFLGHLVVAGAAEPTPFDLVLLRSLAQQTGIALANARAHANARAANAELAETVASLRSKTAIHDRFTQVALRGEGREGIVAALHELTGLGAGIADGGGTLVAWAGPDADRPASAGPARVVAQALRTGRPVRAPGRLVMAARPRADVVGLLLLVDPSDRAGDAAVVALEHGATVLAIELARLLSLAETELRLGVDVVADLVGGADVAGASRRASALGHDLARPHRVVVLGTRRARLEPEVLVRAVREALDGDRQPLLMHRGDTLVLLAELAAPDDRASLGVLTDAVRAAPGGRAFQIGIGGVCLGPGDFPRSYREAQVAMRIADLNGPGGASVYDDLGVYQLLAEVPELSGVDAFARRWLGALIDYDERRSASLVATLAAFLDVGGNYDATASRLRVGRSTVRYRIARVRELSGHDLGDPGTRFQLHLATKAWYTHRALVESG